MTDDVSLEGWRLVTDLTVVDAAILMAILYLTNPTEGDIYRA